MVFDSLAHLPFKDGGSKNNNEEDEISEDDKDKDEDDDDKDDNDDINNAKNDEEEHVDNDKNTMVFDSLAHLPCQSPSKFKDGGSKNNNEEDEISEDDKDKDEDDDDDDNAKNYEEEHVDNDKNYSNEQDEEVAVFLARLSDSQSKPDGSSNMAAVCARTRPPAQFEEIVSRLGYKATEAVVKAHILADATNHDPAVDSNVDDKEDDEEDDEAEGEEEEQQADNEKDDSHVNSVSSDDNDCDKDSYVPNGDSDNDEGQKMATASAPRLIPTTAKQRTSSVVNLYTNGLDAPKYNQLHKAQQPVAADAPGSREALENIVIPQEMIFLYQNCLAQPKESFFISATAHIQVISKACGLSTQEMIKMRGWVFLKNKTLKQGARYRYQSFQDSVYNTVTRVTNLEVNYRNLTYRFDAVLQKMRTGYVDLSSKFPAPVVVPSRKVSKRRGQEGQPLAKHQRGIFI
jgi:hypothetical protein